MAEHLKLTSRDVVWIKGNWEKIPDKFKTNIKANNYSNIAGVKDEGHFVVLLLDRQKPSIEASYDFNQERVGVNRFGQVIWGFDSGCSCPSPWDDSFPKCYEATRSWKEFISKAKEKVEGEDAYGAVFDTGWSVEAKKKLGEIKRCMRDGNV
jgi:hypothetical protein